jgi:hypothetical protein
LYNFVYFFINLYIYLSKNFFIDSYTKNIKSIDCIEYNHYERYINSTKLHVITDSNNIPIIYEFSEGNIHDVNIAKKLIENTHIMIKQ